MGVLSRFFVFRMPSGASQQTLTNARVTGRRVAFIEMNDSYFFKLAAVCEAIDAVCHVLRGLLL